MLPESVAALKCRIKPGAAAAIDAVDAHATDHYF